jgi:hypothetical protein
VCTASTIRSLLGDSFVVPAGPVPTCSASGVGEEAVDGEEAPGQDAHAAAAAAALAAGTPPLDWSDAMAASGRSGGSGGRGRKGKRGTGKAGHRRCGHACVLYCAVLC